MNHMLPANIRDEFGIPVTETIAAVDAGILPRVHPVLGFVRRDDVLNWIESTR